eukprot:g70138.t1
MCSACSLPQILAANIGGCALCILLPQILAVRWVALHFATSDNVREQGILLSNRSHLDVVLYCTVLYFSPLTRALSWVKDKSPDRTASTSRLQAIRESTVTIRAEPLCSDHSMVLFNIAASGLPAMDVSLMGAGSSDPYLLIQRARPNTSSGQPGFVTVYRTETKPACLEPKWETFVLDTATLCNGWETFVLDTATLCNGDVHRVLRFVCYDYDAPLKKLARAHKQDDLIGSVHTSLAQLLRGATLTTKFPLSRHPTDTDAGGGEKALGQLLFTRTRLLVEYTPAASSATLDVPQPHPASRAVSSTRARLSRLQKLRRARQREQRQEGAAAVMACVDILIQESLGDMGPLSEQEEEMPLSSLSTSLANAQFERLHTPISKLWAGLIQAGEGDKVGKAGGDADNESGADDESKEKKKNCEQALGRLQAHINAETAELTEILTALHLTDYQTPKDMEEGGADEGQYAAMEEERRARRLLTGETALRARGLLCTVQALSKIPCLTKLVQASSSSSRHHGDMSLVFSSDPYPNSPTLSPKSPSFPPSSTLSFPPSSGLSFPPSSGLSFPPSASLPFPPSSALPFPPSSDPELLLPSDDLTLPCSDFSLPDPSAPSPAVDGSVNYSDLIPMVAEPCLASALPPAACSPLLSALQTRAQELLAQAKAEVQQHDPASNALLVSLRGLNFLTSLCPELSQCMWTELSAVRRGLSWDLLSAFIRCSEMIKLERERAEGKLRKEDFQEMASFLDKVDSCRAVWCYLPSKPRIEQEASQLFACVNCLFPDACAKIVEELQRETPSAETLLTHLQRIKKQGGLGTRLLTSSWIVVTTHLHPTPGLTRATTPPALLQLLEQLKSHLSLLSEEAWTVRDEFSKAYGPDPLCHPHPEGMNRDGEKEKKDRLICTEMIGALKKSVEQAAAWDRVAQAVCGLLHFLRDHWPETSDPRLTRGGTLRKAGSSGGLSLEAQVVNTLMAHRRNSASPWSYHMLQWQNLTQSFEALSEECRTEIFRLITASQTRLTALIELAESKPVPRSATCLSLQEWAEMKAHLARLQTLAWADERWDSPPLVSSSSLSSPQPASRSLSCSSTLSASMNTISVDVRAYVQDYDKRLLQLFDTMYNYSYPDGRLGDVEEGMEHIRSLVGGKSKDVYYLFFWSWLNPQLVKVPNVSEEESPDKQ